MRQPNNIAWDDDWIHANYRSDKSITKLAEEYSVSHHPVKAQALRTHMSRNGFQKSGLTWTSEEKDWVKNNFPRLGSLKCEAEFEKVFGKKRSHRSIEACARRLDLYVDSDVVESNKNYSRRVPIGTIVDDGEGYLKIKTGKGSSGWQRYHRYLWEQRNGKIPNGYKIIFLDGNRRNYDPSNMAIVPSKFLAWMNKMNLKSEDPEITKTSIAWCELYDALKKSGPHMECEP